MRENRPYGSEGGEAKAFPTPMCVREDVLSVGCESPPRGAIPREAEGNCVVNTRGGGVCTIRERRRGGEQLEANA
jgi:hypothetical protein